MTVVETVIFSATADLKAYVLTEADANGKSWDLSKWKSRGEGEVRILKPSGAIQGNIRVLMKGVGIANKDQVLTNHLVHPETVFRIDHDGLSRMFWVQDESEADGGAVDTCLELVFGEREEAEEFERQYTDSQETMEQLHKSSESQWRFGGPKATAAPTEETPVAEVRKMKKEKEKEVDPTNLYPSSSEDEGGEEDDSECSEISLEETDEDERVEAKPMIVPSFKSQEKLWKCNGCTTPNPESAQKCLCCELPRGEEVQKKDKQSITVNFAAMNSTSSNSDSAKPSFDFASASASSSSKPVFDFGGSASTSTGGADDKPSFGFGGQSKPSFSFQTTDATKSSTAFNFGDVAKAGKEGDEAGKKKDVAEVKDAEKENSRSAYPPFETMKKVEQLVPGAKKTQSPYPPMETMKKVDQVFGSSKDTSEQAKKSEVTAKSAASAYPPMETMKKVDQLFGSSKDKNEAASESKVAAKPPGSAYPPMETMKKVEQVVPGAASSKEKEATAASTKSAYPPMETMQKVDQMFGKSTPPAKSEQSKGPTFGGLSSGFGTSTSPSPFTGAFGGESQVSPGLFSGNQDKKPPTSLFGNTIAASRSLFGTGGSDEATTSDPGEVKSKLVQFYKDFNPDNLHKVDLLVEKYKGREETLFDNLAKKYNLSKEKRAELFGKPVEISGFGLPMSSTSTFSSSTPTGLSGFSALGSALSATATTRASAQPISSTSIRGADQSDNGDSSDSDAAQTPQNTPANGNLFTSPAITSTPTFAAPTMSSSFGLGSSSQQVNPPTSTVSTPGSGFGGSTGGVAFGQPATLGAGSANAFGISSPSAPQVPASGAGFGGETGGFAAFAGGQQSSSGFASLAKTGETSFLKK